jgi:hypothetical protein
LARRLQHQIEMAAISRRSARWCRLAISTLGLALALGSRGAEPPGGAAAALEDFERRVQGYLELRERATRSIAPLRETDTPEQITAREQALGEAIRKHRSGARRGELFGAAEPVLVAIVQDDLRRRSASERAALVSELPSVPAPEVGSVYPSEYPLLTFPLKLLERMPELPEPLEYRFYGRHLILRETEANLIVDVIPEIRPAPSAP